MSRVDEQSEMSGDVGSPVGGRRVGVSLLRSPSGESQISSERRSPRGSGVPEDQEDGGR